jgi:hypothetical protein
MCKMICLRWLSVAEFIKWMMTEQSLEVLKHPETFALLGLIARRAVRPGVINVLGLNDGEAFVGDFKEFGMTESTYRTTKKRLAESGLATFRSTNRGTIASLCSSIVFDISRERVDGQNTGGMRTDQQANDVPTATNKKNRRIEIDIPVEFPSLDVKEFLDAWVEFLNHRKRLGKAIVGESIRRQLKKAAAVGAGLAAEMMRRAVDHGWVGWMFENSEQKKTCAATSGSEGDAMQRMLKRQREGSL